jgi:hypothetical protein
MFAGQDDAADKAKAAADFFADATRHKSHSRGIFRDEARVYGLDITDLEEDQALQEAVLSVHHAAMHTVGSLPVAKLIENHMGRAFIRQAPIVIQPGKHAGPQQPQPPQPQQSPPPPVAP